MPRRHVHITLPPELHDRTRALVDRLPFLTLSGMIEDFLNESVPYLEATVEAADKGDIEAMRSILSGMIGDKVMHMLLPEEVDDT